MADPAATAAAYDALAILGADLELLAHVLAHDGGMLLLTTRAGAFGGAEWHAELEAGNGWTFTGVAATPAGALRDCARHLRRSLAEQQPTA